MVRDREPGTVLADSHFIAATGFDVVSAERIAVIGSGIAGLASAWLLSRDYQVTLFEANDYLGGHANTVDVTLAGVTAPVDTGFLVFNDRTYPNLVAMFGELGVACSESDMSFSVRVDEDALEWAGSNLATVFAQKRNFLRPRFLRMLRDVIRFNRESMAALARGGLEEISLREFLIQGNYSDAFRDWYLLPMSGAIWSCSTEQMLRFPAETFLRFCSNHGLLQISDRPTWKTVSGGSRQYVRKLCSRLSDVRLSNPVRLIVRRPDAVHVFSREGSPECFSQVVLACHSDQALSLLSDTKTYEQSILSKVRYQPNDAVLHTDVSLLPKSRKAWAAWNYAAGGSSPTGRPVSVTYLINRLQPLPFAQPLMVTLNPVAEPHPDSVIRRFHYSHPIFDRQAISAQLELQAIQGLNRTWFCGAWTANGFHEDGLNSALKVVNTMGTYASWQTRPSVRARPARLCA